MAKLVSPSADKENCREVKKPDISPEGNLSICCQICGLQTLPGAANLDSYMRGTVKNPAFLYLHRIKRLCPQYEFFRPVYHILPLFLVSVATEIIY